MGGSPGGCGNDARLDALVEKVIEARAQIEAPAKTTNDTGIIMFGNENTIEPTQAASRGAGQVRDKQRPIREATRWEEAKISEETETAKPAVKADAAPAADAFAAKHKLYTVDKRQIRIFYADYQQKTEVMRAEPARITTRRDDKQTINAMLDLAETRGWSSVKLRGSERFVREAWVQAQVRGIATEGYKPKQADLQEAAQRKAAAAPAPKAIPVDVHAAAPADRTPAPEPKAEALVGGSVEAVRITPRNSQAQRDAGRDRTPTAAPGEAQERAPQHAYAQHRSAGRGR